MLKYMHKHSQAYTHIIHIPNITNTHKESIQLTLLKMSGWGWSCPRRRPWVGCWLRMSLKLQGVRWGPKNRGDVFSSNHSSLGPLLRQLNAESVLDVIVAGDGGHVPYHTDPLGRKEVRGNQSIKSRSVQKLFPE